jgi:hypothetical protein
MICGSCRALRLRLGFGVLNLGRNVGIRALPNALLVLLENLCFSPGIQFILLQEPFDV